MQIRLNDTPRLDSYAQALAVWDKIAPWRGAHDENERPLDSRKKHHVTIRKAKFGERDAIACTLYATDCVIFYEDGQIDLDGSYNSVSTRTFINTISNTHGMMVGSNAVYISYADQRVYRPSNGCITLQKDVVWHRVDPDSVKPFVSKKINRKVAKRIVDQTEYAAFRTFGLAYAGTMPKQKHWGRLRLYFPRHIDIETALAGGVSEWRELIDGAGVHDLASMHTLLTKVREHLYRRYAGDDLYTTVEHPYVEVGSGSGWHAIERAQRYRKQEYV